ncbi:hypothetical protein BJV82DRAFT_679912 [Fennellomyces sp. T-0311]|nr:hypothetical protein BJV82DRAFT_679912 [Fennellomyces sp. T-0311]
MTAKKSRTHNNSIEAGKPTKNNKPPVRWETDAPDKNPAHSSDSLLVGWLTIPGNYSRYKGAKTKMGEGKTKKSICEYIVANVFEPQGIFHRNDVDVNTRINLYEDKFKKAHKWLHDTGNGTDKPTKNSPGDDYVTANWPTYKTESVEFQSDMKEKIKVYVITNIFKYYYDLLPIFKDRASLVPPAPMSNNDDIRPIDFLFPRPVLSPEERNEEGEQHPQSGMETLSSASPMTSGKRLLSIAADDKNENKGKKARGGVEAVLAAAIEKQQRIGIEKNALLREQFEFQMSLEKKKLQIETWRQMALDGFITKQEMIDKINELL